MMRIFTFAYEMNRDGRYVPNGLLEDSKYYSRWLSRTDEYCAEDCGNPLKSIFKTTGISIQDQTVEECLAQGKKFIYPIEILRSNHAWLLPKLYREHSPWPAISESTKKALRQGQAVILLTHLKLQSDSSRGDPVRSHVFERLHAALNHFQIPPSAVVYAGVSAELPKIYQQFLQTHTVPEPLRAVEYVNYLEKGWFLYFEKYRAAGEIFDFESCKKDSSRLRTHKFLCFNHEPRAHRKLNLMWLFKNNLLEENLISFGTTEHLLKYDAENPLPQDSEFADLMRDYPAAVESRLPMIVDAPKGLHISFCTRWPFADSYFSFLTERIYDCQNGWTLLTPKVFKAICNVHPFIVLGQHGYLESIRSAGYKTFSPFIDESYDLIEDPVQRTKAVWQEVRRLCAMSMPELHQWYYSMLPILEHNHSVFLARRKSSEYDRFVQALGSLHEL